MTAILEKTINGRGYRLVKLPPLSAGRIATVVAQALAGALSDAATVSTLLGTLKNRAAEKAPTEGVADSLAGKVLDVLGDDAAVLSALAGGLQNVKVEALYRAAEECLVGQLFAEAKLHDRAAVERHFGDHPQDLFPVMVWALRENCTGFFGKGAPASN